MNKEANPKSAVRTILNVIYIALALAFVLGVFLGPGAGGSYVNARQSAAMQTARAIGLCLFAYAQDHNGRYPEGKTSTEIFQQLIDGKYVTDATVFCIRMPGKEPAQSTQLKPENVSWDVTCCLDASAPDTVPVVFLTGYKITYAAGTSAVPLTQPAGRTWSQWWSGVSPPKLFIAVCYKDSSARAIRSDENDSIPNFIPADFDPKGKTYRQLMP